VKALGFGGFEDLEAWLWRIRGLGGSEGTWRGGFEDLEEVKALGLDGFEGTAQLF